MAEVPEDLEIWLPAKFLPDEDLFMEKKSLKDEAFGSFSLKFPNEFPIEFDSFGSSPVISSPVESTASSFDAESSDEFLAVLTQRLAQSALYETMKPAVPYHSPNEHEKKNWFVSVSPQSTLTGFGRLSGTTGKVSGHGSPNGPLQFPSPPESPFGAEKDAWDLIFAAVGQVARLETGFNSSEHSINPIPQRRTHLSARCPSTLTCLKSPASVSYVNQRLYQNTPQSSQFHGPLYDQVLKEECSMECRKIAPCSVMQHQRQQFAACGRTNRYENGRYEPLRAAVHKPWQAQTHGQQPQLKVSTFQPSFKGESCAQRESVGTGVFLPRRYPNPPEPRKQTVLPAVRPAKFHGNGMSYTEPNECSRVPFNSGSGRVHDVSAGPKYELSPQKRQTYGADAAAQMKELFLPLEWTY